MIPLARDGIFTGAALSVAHTMGEFGIVLMMEVSIPGSTRVAPITQYDEVQMLHYDNAHTFSLILLLASLILLSHHQMPAASRRSACPKVMTPAVPLPTHSKCHSLLKTVTGRSPLPRRLAAGRATAALRIDAQRRLEVRQSIYH